MFRLKTQKTFKTFLSVLMVMLTCFVPLLSFAQQNPAIARAITEGEVSARANTNNVTWLCLGCIGGPVTVLVALNAEPQPPAETLLGKSPGYVEAYTEAYKSKAKSLQSRYATIGCFAGIGIGSLLWATYRYGFNRADSWWTDIDY